MHIAPKERAHSRQQCYRTAWWRLRSNRLTSQQTNHLAFTKKRIDETAGYINELQKFVGVAVSWHTLNQMIIRDSREAIACAKEALVQNDPREGIPIYTFTMWFERFRTHLESIRTMQRRVGASGSTAALTDLCEQLIAIDVYLERDEVLRHGKIRSYIPNDEIVVKAEELLETFRSLSGGQLEFVPGEADSVNRTGFRGPAD
ncbi:MULTISPECIES: hypothetical protein [Serratia]|uniref:hypothetical protein n=1 Tax=Serratia TaxID=613 RepID=UPI00384AF0D2